MGKKYIKKKDTYVQRYVCKTCRCYFSSQRESKQEGKDALVRSHLEERSSYRILARKTGLDKNTILRTVVAKGKTIKSTEEIATMLKPRWTGILVVDGKYVNLYDWAARYFPQRKQRHKASLLLGIDVPSGDVPHHHLGEEESKIDLVLYFKSLKRMRYPLKVLVSDGNKDIRSAAEHVYGKTFTHQLCVKHFTDGLLRMVHREKRMYQEKTLFLVVVIKQVLLAKNCFWLRLWFEYLLRIGEAFFSGVQQKLWILFFTKFSQLVGHHSVTGVPRTTNYAENINRQLILRLSSIVQFRRWENAVNYMKMWFLWRRCTPYTDCKGKNKWKNGKSPLELCGCDMTNIDYLNL